MDIKQIFKNNQQWVEKKLNIDTNYFNNLAEGQKPEILYIGCSDSRVSVEELMGFSPGEAFIHRNIANLVPNNDLSALSVIDYAVSHLKVKHIVICGHYNYGGVKAAMQSEDMGVLNPWIDNIRDVYRLHSTELNNITNEEERYKKLVEINVQEQCINNSKLNEVQKAYRDSRIAIHGWVFDIHSGMLIDLRINL